jgi:hypothetical protein
VNKASESEVRRMVPSLVSVPISGGSYASRDGTGYGFAGMSSIDAARDVRGAVLWLLK